MKLKRRIFSHAAPNNNKFYHIVDNVNIENRMMIMANKFEPKHKYLVDFTSDCHIDHGFGGLMPPGGIATNYSECRMLDIYSKLPRRLSRRSSELQDHTGDIWRTIRHEVSIDWKLVKKYIKSVLEKIKRKFK